MTYRLVFLLLVLASGCRQPKPAEPPLFAAPDSAQTGVGFVNRVVDTPTLNIIDYLYFYNGGGVATGDLNNDGLADLYFVSNQGPNKLYLNRTKKGEITHFENVTAKANVPGRADWQTGVTLADVNADGLLDIYVCAVSGFRGLRGHNELYINNGPGPGGIPTFTEQAAAYGLAFAGFSTQAAFFDYDHDNDLDCFLLNHAVHSVRSFDQVSARAQADSLAGDFLFENTGQFSPSRAGTLPNAPHPVFKPARQSGIFQAPMGYGLGLAVADFNNDGWDDLYVSNDFHEDDYLYQNNRRGPGTGPAFTNVAPAQLAHTSRFSMGSDAADVNHDGWPDLVTLDMYPHDETVEKSSAGEDPLDIYTYKLAYGYMNQYSRNCLQINQNGQSFADVAALAGIAATDWSWSALLADYDLDGQTDLFIGNGIARRPNNLDYVKYIANDSVQQALNTNPATMLGRAVGMMPEGKVPNFLYRGVPVGGGGVQFEDKSTAWGFSAPSLASGAAYADLDNDGDLDLVTNNLNEPAGIYLNQTDQLFPQHTYLSVGLRGTGGNTGGVGAKVILRYGRGGDTLQTQQLMPTRGFQSAVEPRLTFGLGTRKTVDSLVVIWPNQQMEVRLNVSVNQRITLNQADARLDGSRYVVARPTARRLLVELPDSTLFPYRHRENARYLDFARESLMPFKVSTEGPHLAVGDVNADGLDDVYAGGARDQPGQLLLQTAAGRFVPSPQPVLAADSASEDVDALFFDADGDRDLDLYVVSGGNEFSLNDSPLRDRLYLNTGAAGAFSFTKATYLPPLAGNKSCVRAADVDNDGDLDLFVGGRVVASRYGLTPDSYLLLNTGNRAGQPRFVVETDRLVPGLRTVGMVTDARWADLNGDRLPDLVVVGEWMAPRVFLSKKGRLEETNNVFGPMPMQGFWHCLAAADFDNDGDTDFMAGNLGPNTKFRRGEAGQVRMWVKDLDGNQTTDQILAITRPNGSQPDGSGMATDWFPLATKDELGKQLPGIINKRFVTYASLAGKTVADMFTPDELANATERTVDQFSSVYLENQTKKGEQPRFQVRVLPFAAQVSALFALTPVDLDNDGDLDVLGGGNFYGVSTYQGRYDASNGLVLLNQNGQFTAPGAAQTGFVLWGEIRSIGLVRGRAGGRVLVGRNGARAQVFR